MKCKNCGLTISKFHGLLWHDTLHTSMIGKHSQVIHTLTKTVFFKKQKPLKKVCDYPEPKKEVE